MTAVGRMHSTLTPLSTLEKKVIDEIFRWNSTERNKFFNQKYSFKINNNNIVKIFFLISHNIPINIETFSKLYNFRAIAFIWFYPFVSYSIRNEDNMICIFPNFSAVGANFKNSSAKTSRLFDNETINLRDLNLMQDFFIFNSSIIFIWLC